MLINDRFPSWLNVDYVVIFFKECLLGEQNINIHFSNETTSTYVIRWVLSESGFYVELPLDNNKEYRLTK